jgi:hypothetical protein
MPAQMGITMVQTLQASTIDLQDLISNFNLQAIEDLDFFREWQDDLSAITDLEKQSLDKIRKGYWNLINHPPLREKAIQISVLGPLLFLADFYLPPFHIQAEKAIEITAEDKGVVIRGQIDIWLLKEQFWALVIESKEAAFSIEPALAQLLAYMLASPQVDKPCFGLIASGGSFCFVKLVQGEINRYAISRIFEIRNPGNDLYDVFKSLKRISQV